MTPMLRQYFDLKQQARGAVLFFRMGDFYEMFGDDAAEVAPKLQIVLTSREKGNNERIPFCGVPHHSVKNYWLRLLRMGYKVAIADQVEDPSVAKGLVRREITRFLTPACVDELESLDADQPNYLVAILEEPNKHIWSIVAADVSTADLRVGEAEDFEGVVRLLSRLQPKEVLARSFHHTKLQAALAQISMPHTALAEMPEAILRDAAKQKQIISKTLGKPIEKIPGVKHTGNTNVLVSALFEYLTNLYFNPERFLAAKPLHASDRIQLDAIVCRDLELFETSLRREADGSLFKEINRTLTPMGARALRYDLAHPYASESPIVRRNTCVSYLKDEPKLLQSWREILSGTGDLERLSTRIVAGSITPNELGVMRSSLRKLAEFANAQPKTSNAMPTPIHALITELTTAEATTRLLGTALIAEPGRPGHGNEIFAASYDKTLDQKNLLAHRGEERMLAYEEKLRAETGISSLKVKNHKSFGLLIEVTKTHAAKIPPTFIRKQTMVNGERFTTPELQTLDVELSQAFHEAIEREQQLYSDLVQKLREHRPALLKAANAIAQLDIIQAFAFKALQANFCKPAIAKDGTLQLIGCRHPVVEGFVGKHAYTPNDIVIKPDTKRILLTGPNMAGKSTIMRQTAIASLLHQVGSFVPATQANLPLFDQFFTRVGASDDLARGQSTFMVEMSEAAYILRQATAKSLVILDEVGRGTSTQDGVAIAAAILEDLVQRIDCYALFATHYHELVPFAHKLSGVKLMQTEAREEGEQVIFTHRLIDGASGGSFGLEVAKLAGLPPTTLSQAEKLLKEGLTHPAPSGERPAKSTDARVTLPKDLEQIMEIAARIQTLRIHRTTPLQALNMLNEMKSLLDNPAATELFIEQ